MKETKIEHTASGIYWWLILLVVSVGLLIFAVYAMIHNEIRVRSIFLFVSVVFFCYFTFRAMKPLSTTLTFSDLGISSQCIGDTDFLDIKDIVGVWIVTKRNAEFEFVKYNSSMTPRELKNKIILFGDIETLSDESFMKNILIDTFTPSYTSVFYRSNSGLEDIMNDYNLKIEEQSKSS